MQIIPVKTRHRVELIDITDQIGEVVTTEGLLSGLVVAYVPHTTAGITINENADPDVVHDLLLCLAKLAPAGLSQYRHAEGNSDAHVKASLIGSCVTIIVENGKLCLGTWQGVFFCEFDGPRSRRLMIQLS